MPILHVVSVNQVFNVELRKLFCLSDCHRAHVSST